MVVKFVTTEQSAHDIVCILHDDKTLLENNISHDMNNACAGITILAQHVGNIRFQEIGAVVVCLGHCGSCKL